MARRTATDAATVMKTESAAFKRGRSSRLKYTPQPLGEKKRLPRRPLPPVCISVTTTVPSCAPFCANSFKAVFVEFTSSK